MNMTSTHFFVPTDISPEQRASCLGPDGAVAHVSRVIRMIQGRWKLPILFRLYADDAMRTLQIERIDFNEKPLRVEYRLSPLGRDLMPVLIAARAFSVHHTARGAATA